MLQVLNAISKIVVVTVQGIWRVATSDIVRAGVQRAGAAILAVGAAVGMGGLNLLGRAFPKARKIVRVGIIGGFRYFKGSFNSNGGANIQSTRNALSPLEWISAGVSAIVLMFAPLFGGAMLLSTYIIFFRDVESLPLSTFGADSAGVDSIIGIGTGLVISLFNLFSAIRSTIRWVGSQFK